MPAKEACSSTLSTGEFNVALGESVSFGWPMWTKRSCRVQFCNCSVKAVATLRQEVSALQWPLYVQQYFGHSPRGHAKVRRRLRGRLNNDRRRPRHVRQLLEGLLERLGPEDAAALLQWACTMRQQQQRGVPVLMRVKIRMFQVVGKWFQSTARISARTSRNERLSGHGMRREA